MIVYHLCCYSFDFHEESLLCGFKMSFCFQKTQVVEEEEKEEEEQTTEASPEPAAELEAEMETDGSLPLCIGPGCSKQALPDSVYCGNDCILQHAAVTMKTLSGPKVAKSRGRAQRKASTARATVTVSKISLQTEKCVAVCR